MINYFNPEGIPLVRKQLELKWAPDSLYLLPSRDTTNTPFDKNDLEKIGWNLNSTEGIYVNENTKNTTVYPISKDKLVIHAYHPAYWVISNDVYCSEIVSAVKLWNS